MSWQLASLLLLGGSTVLSQGTCVPWPHSQKTSAPTEVSGRLCFLPQFLHANQIMLRPFLAPRIGSDGSFQYAAPADTMANVIKTKAERSREKPRGMRALYRTP